MNIFHMKPRFATAALIAVFLAAALSAEPAPVTLDAAVAAALAGDERLESAAWDLKSAEAKAREAELRRLPALSLSASYTRLSELESTVSFGAMSIPIKSLVDSWSLQANLQYPVFAGFRLSESVALAKTQAAGKGVAEELMRRAVAFETKRAYWEAVRASRNVATLEENLQLAEKNYAVTAEQERGGAAMKADLLAADLRRSQARMDLGAAKAARRRAFWSLASLIGDASASASGEPEGALALVEPLEPPSEAAFPTLSEPELVARALAGRPEIKGADLGAAAAEIGQRVASAPLYPTVALTGSYLYADPNPRAAFQSDPWLFTGTWTLGVTVSYDLGGLPANLASREAQGDAASRARADATRQRELVANDVRSCLLSYLQAKGDYALLAGMTEQARENERVVAERVRAGMASDLDLLAARTSRLKVEFSVANKLVDWRIAAADLERAAATGL